MKSTWVNFNSYYNTFYNAKQSYDRGYRQFENQVDRINPEQPIRIHRAPVRTGRADFEDAIERGTDVLINFPESKYVDDAVALIGRSYYFLENFFNAEQKFIELASITESEDKLQQSVIWRARIMLDLKRHNEATTFLSNHLDSPEFEWGRREKAEAQLLLAQHLVKMQRWEEAGEILYVALPDIRDRELRARGYFLHGQILEFIGAYEAAYDAYDRVRRSNPYYQMIYFSELRKGIVLRKNGDYQEAFDLFSSMSRNNNNFDYLPEINYEIGRTLQQMGFTDQAKRRYTEVLYYSHRTPQRETLAKTHYGLAEIYRFDFRNYNLAAAYYDSSARNAGNEEMLPIGFDARTISRSFNEFARLNEQAVEKDSLLWLGSLPPAKFDSVLVIIQEQYRRQMEQERRQQQRDSGRIVTIDPDQIEEAAESDENGFLFHLNRTLMAQASQQFQIRWNSRPLVDNWRRQEAVRQAQVAAEEDEKKAEEIVYVEEIDPIDLELDLTQIPRTRQARQKMQNDLARLRYEIGNIYFISLNMPDSARAKYEQIIVNHPDSEIIPQTMYSLSELHYLDGDDERSRYWAGLIAEKHPQTTFARRLSDRFDLGLVTEEIELAPEEQKIQDYYRMLSSIDTLSVRERAETLFEFAESDTLTSYAPDAYLASAQNFVLLAREDTTFVEKSREYSQAHKKYSMGVEKLEVLQDSAAVVLADTTITDDLRMYWESVKDSTVSKPDFRALFPFYGDDWDNARTSLERIKERFPRYSRINRVNALYGEIELLPEEPEEEEEPETKPEEPDLPEVDESQVYECEVIGEDPEIIGGLAQFLEQSELPGLLGEMNILQAVFSYRITIDPDGYPEQIHSLDEEDEFGFQEFLMNEIQSEMRFEPIIYNDFRIRAICNIDIAIEADTE